MSFLVRIRKHRAWASGSCRAHGDAGTTTGFFCAMPSVRWRLVSGCCRSMSSVAGRAETVVITGIKKPKAYAVGG